MMLARAVDLLALLVLPIVLVGLINRTKALWSGRKGPPILQLAFDLARLARKAPLYSTTTTLVFRVVPFVLLATAAASTLLTPFSGSAPLLSFSYDFVWFAYAWGLGRVGLMLGAFDTGSSFEGMGAAREATFATVVEPAFFLVTGALSVASGSHSVSDALTHVPTSTAGLVLRLAAVVALLIVLQAETARMPVDDPSTHLELTMVHEVMVLDHSGLELAAIQLGTALKLTVGAAFVATLLNPWAGEPGLLCASLNIALCLALAVVIGTIESLTARLKLRAVPLYLLAAVGAGLLAVVAATWRGGAS